MDALIDRVTAIANSIIRFNVAKMCRVREVNEFLHKAMRRMILMKKVKPAAIIRKAANW